jgi:hypothetical protein
MINQIKNKKNIKFIKSIKQIYYLIIKKLVNDVIILSCKTKNIFVVDIEEKNKKKLKEILIDFKI